MRSRKDEESSELENEYYLLYVSTIVADDARLAISVISARSIEVTSMFSSHSSNLKEEMNIC